MSGERRFSATEVEEIFRRATEESDGSPSRTPATQEGMTLWELQEIGEEVGIAPERVADAASALDRPKSSLLPLSVRRTVSLPRDLTDDEWNRLLADLRATFDAPGKLHLQGGLKGWTNGNLHAFVEPTDSGYRLRMGTTKASVRSYFAGGGAMLALALVLMVVRVLTGGLGDALDGLAILSLLGLGLIGVGAIQLPGWARTRRRQMEEISERLRSSMQGLPPGDS